MKTIIQKAPSGRCMILLPQTLASELMKDGQKRFICKINQSFTLHCAILNSKKLGFYIGIGKKTLKDANLAIDQEIEIELLPDHNPYQSEIPEELVEVLQSDAEGYQKFHQLTPGKQRSIIYLVAAVKSSEKKIERALKIIDNIKLGITDNRKLLK